MLQHVGVTSAFNMATRKALVKELAPLRKNATLEAIGGTAVWMLSDWGACTTGEIVLVDGGYHVLGMPQSENL